MRIRDAELWIAFFVISGITVLYLGLVFLSGIPEAGEFWGHSLGIIGFFLMFMTETLYSLRKRSRKARWGRLSHWLSFHIFTGLVGPYMVLLHTAWKFNGLAGILMLLTVIIVLSGIIGRYIYTAVPRTADGAVIEAEQIQTMINRSQNELDALRDDQPDIYGKMKRVLDRVSNKATKPVQLIMGRGFADWADRWHWWLAQKGMDARQRAQVKQLWENQQRLITLNRQLASLGLARRMLAVWHTIHIPIGVVLFSVAFIHIVATLYYATFLH